MFNITELTCRVCLLEQQEILINVFDELEDLQTNLSSLLEKCGDMQVEENDIFPKYLCEECTRELLISAKFRDKCLKSKEIFEELLKENKVVYDDADSFSQMIEYSTEEGEKDFTVVVSDDVERRRTSSEHINENELQSFQGDSIEDSDGNQHVEMEEVENDILFVPKIVEATSQEVVCDSVIAYDESSSPVDVEDAPVSVADYGSITVKANDYEVHIDLSDTAFIKAMPLKVKKLKSFKCDICGAAFVQAINLQKHLQKTHAPTQCYSCATCDHWFSLEIELFKHAKYCKESNSDDEYSNEDKNRRISRSSITNEPIESHKRCVYCDREFQTPFALRMHTRTHTGERPFQCQYCDKAFKTQSSLSAHIKRHTGQADFVCSVCGKSFYERGNLDVHMRSHTGERPHSCTVCQKTFTRVFLLELHMRTHTGERPFRCSICDRSFRQRSDWKIHLGTHTGVKHNCTLCSKGYIKRSSLVQHMRTHSGLQVDFENDVSQQSNEDICQVEQAEIVHSFDDIIESKYVLQSKEVS